MLGLLGLLIFHAKTLSHYIRQNIGVSVILSETAEEQQIKDFRYRLDTCPFIRKTVYISKEQAAEELMEDLGEDFINFIGYNPLSPSFEVFLNAEYTFDDSLKVVEKKLNSEAIVKEVFYQKSLIELINTNITKISVGILSFSFLLLIISVILIYNTIRLAIYSKRLLIKSMLLVGATQNFIRKPFIMNGLYQGLLSGALAIALLGIILYISQLRIPELTLLQDQFYLAILFAGVVIFGVVISWLSNYFAVKKYLRVDSDDLY
nr:cell division protein FtsX [Bacteroidota bacterium]